ncbi:MAG TPA: LegC family aminotransferase [Candidatus Ozemobacteraceae bacterium]|nr:LegC family aminotransferase [Candidatus Ozemobacteraceae bacterium]
MLLDGILEALRKVVPPGAQPLHEPEFAGREWEYVKDCLDTGWVSSVGNYVDRFEAMLAEFTGAKRVIATVNGTAALHVCLLLAGVEEGDEVIIPDLTFVATANAVAYCRATPLLADVEEQTLGLAPAPLATWLADNTRIETDRCIDRHTGRRIRAVVPMHTFGHPVDLDPLVGLCNEYHLVLIEDAAESLGSYYKGRHTGRFGRLAALSFNGNKTVTTGGGGAIMTDDEELGRLANHLTTTARQPHRWEFFHDMTAYNYRLPNLNAALGCAQLERLPDFLRRKRALAEAYHRAFAGVTGAAIFREPEFARSNYWLNVLLLDEEQAMHRDALLEATNACGIGTRPAWTLMHRLPMYAACPRLPTPVAESLARRLVNLPSSPRLAPA